MTDRTPPSQQPRPGEVDRLIIQQYDITRAVSIGGIDTCLRGICRYLPADESVAVVGVDTGSGPEGRRLGRWERHRIGEQAFWFLPVAALDPADQDRRIPHVVRLLSGIARFRGRIPRRTIVQVHRMDSAFILRALLPGDQVYMIRNCSGGGGQAGIHALPSASSVSTSNTALPCLVAVER